MIFIGLAGYTQRRPQLPPRLAHVAVHDLGVSSGTGGGWLYLNPIHRRITGLSFEMVSFLSIIALSNLIVSSYARPLTGGDIGLSPIDGLFTTTWLAVVLAVLLRAAASSSPGTSGRTRARSSTSPGRTSRSSARPVPTRTSYTGRLLLLSGLVGSHRRRGVRALHRRGRGVEHLRPAFMIRIIVMAIIGGRFSLRGAILGAYLVVFLSMQLMQYVDAYVQFLVIYGLGFIIYFALPKGSIWHLRSDRRSCARLVRAPRRRQTTRRG